MEALIERGRGRTPVDSALLNSETLLLLDDEMVIVSTFSAALRLFGLWLLVSELMGVVMRVEVVAREDEPEDASDENVEQVDDKEDVEDVRDGVGPSECAIFDPDKGEEGRRAEMMALGSTIIAAEVRDVRGEEARDDRGV